MNLQPNPATARIIRSTVRGGRTLSAVAYNNLANNGQVFTNSTVNVQFLTPSLDVPLPPKSIVNYMEFPRYITQYAGQPIQPGQTGQIISQTITLPCIPDLLLIYARPASYNASDADWFFPLATSNDGIRNPLSINFDNFSGLMSSFTTEQLFNLCVHNGLDMDWNTWVGQGRSAGGAYPAAVASPALNYSARVQGQQIPLVGSLLVLKPSQDITLQSGQAPSLVGNFTLQFNLTVKNTSEFAQTPQLYVITANSGFFESIRGSSRILKGVLSEQDVISAPLAPFAVRSELNRMVGGFSWGALASALMKAYKVSKPFISMGKHALPKDSGLRKVLETVGYGEGMGSSGGARSGGRGRKSLESRLM